MQKNLNSTPLAKIVTDNVFMFIVLLLCGCFLSVCLCHDLRWDFANYHYYNAFAFLHNRLNYDIVPASINTFFNPLLDLPLYFAIQYFNDNLPILFALQGIWTGLLLFMLYKICSLFFNLKSFEGFGLTILVILIAVGGQATLIQIGTSTNEIPIAFMILSGLYILLKMIKFPDTQNLWKFLTAGLIMGAALGFKQTAVVYCVSAGLMLMCCFPYFKNPVKSIFVFAIGGLIGFLVINGWWMWKLWVLYDNPVFPFLNGVFKSEYFDNFNYRDERYLPTLKTLLIYPYLWYFPPHEISEFKYYDFRLTLIYTVLWSILISCLWHRNIKEKYQTQKLETALYFYVFISFMLWLSVFSILRYAVVIEVLSAIFLVWIFKFFMRKNKALVIIYGIFLLFFSFIIIQQAQNWSNLRKDGKFAYVEPVNFPENTLLKLYNFRTAGVVPEWAKNNQFRAVGYMHYNCRYMTGSDFVERGKFRKERDAIVKQHTGPIVIVYEDAIGFNANNMEVYKKMKTRCLKIQQAGKIPASYDCGAGSCITWKALEKALVAELGKDNYFCRPLRNNLDKSLKICVPYKLKAQILGEKL